MKTPIVITVLIFLSLFCNGQNRKEDKILKINGETVIGHVVNVSEYDVTFSYPDEEVTYTITKNIIKEIRFGSGRVEKITEPVIILGEEDWEKVKITTIASEIKGLVYKGDVTEKVAGVNEKKLEKKIKKKTAILGGHLFYMESKSISVNNTFIITGKAYGY